MTGRAHENSESRTHSGPTFYQTGIRVSVDVRGHEGTDVREKRGEILLYSGSSKWAFMYMIWNLGGEENNLYCGRKNVNCLKA